MRRTFFISSIGICLFFSTCLFGATSTPVTEKEKISYIFGLSIGANLKQQPTKIDLKKVLRGIEDSYAGKEPLMSEEDIRKTTENFKKRMSALREKKMAEREREMKKVAEKNAREGRAFLKKNKKKKGVVTLPSGLQYEILKSGSGKRPKAESTVVTHYRGKTIDGKEFDSSYKRGKPATFRVKGVIKGWVEALRLMKTGAKWKLYIPPELAYGERGAGRDIGPNATLIFEIELLGIK